MQRPWAWTLSGQCGQSMVSESEGSSEGKPGAGGWGGRPGRFLQALTSVPTDFMLSEMQGHWRVMEGSSVWLPGE